MAMVRLYIYGHIYARRTSDRMCVTQIRKLTEFEMSSKEMKSEIHHTLLNERVYLCARARRLSCECDFFHLKVIFVFFFFIFLFLSLSLLINVCVCVYITNSCSLSIKHAISKMIKLDISVIEIGL